ncbi:hypothetical protein Tco_0090279 [Tanacetum coccineum]
MQVNVQFLNNSPNGQIVDIGQSIRKDRNRLITQTFDILKAFSTEESQSGLKKTTHIHKEKMIMCKQAEQRCSSGKLSKADWLEDTKEEDWRNRIRSTLQQHGARFRRGSHLKNASSTGQP